MLSRCATCDIEIRWQPTVVDGRSFCCVGCSQGGPCSCDYANLPHKPTSMILFVVERDETTTIRVTVPALRDM